MVLYSFQTHLEPLGGVISILVFQGPKNDHQSFKDQVHGVPGHFRNFFSFFLLNKTQGVQKTGQIGSSSPYFFGAP